MAPEQLLGGPVDRSTDVYALGCLAYDLLAGRHLFSGTTVFELVQQKMAPQVPAASEIGAGISRELHEFLERAVRVRPDERPSSLAPLLAWAAPCDPLPEGLSGGG
jgi:serine/threonine protein kinase